MGRLFKRAEQRGPASPEEMESGVAPGPMVHTSPGLATIFATPAGSTLNRILDLGPAVGENLAFYAHFARTVRFVDMLRDTCEDGSPPPQAVIALLDSCLSAGDQPYDLVIAWDLLNYLEHDGRVGLIERLTECSQIGTRLFAMVSNARTMPTKPLRFTIVDTRRVAYGDSGGGERVSPNLAPAEVERLLFPFRVERSVVLSHGVREYVATRPRAAQRDDDAP